MEYVGRINFRWRQIIVPPFLLIREFIVFWFTFIIYVFSIEIYCIPIPNFEYFMDFSDCWSRWVLHLWFCFRIYGRQQHSRFGSFMRISLFNEKSELNAFPIRSINIFEFACLEIIYSSIVPITKCDGIEFMCFAHDRLDQLHIKCIRHLSLND